MKAQNLKVELALAFRYLKPKRNAVSVITCISILGVTLGVAVLIIVLSVMTGFTNLWKEKILETAAHFQVQKSQPSYFSRQKMEVLSKPHDLIKKVKAHLPEVDLMAVTQSPVLMQKADNFELMTMVGIEPPLSSDTGIANKKISDLRRNLIQGEVALEKNEAMISSFIAMKLGLRIGDKFLVHGWNRLKNLIETDANGQLKVRDNPEVSLPIEFKVTGIYSFNKHDFDKSVFFVGIDDANELLEVPFGSATMLYGWVTNPMNMGYEMQVLRRLFSTHEVLSWEDTNAQFLDVLKMEKTMMFFLLVFIVLVAAFSIMNTLITVVIQKTREIGILKSLGATGGSVMRVFVFQGFIVGFIGNLTGMAMGILVVIFRNDILHFANRMTQQDLFPKEFYFFNGLPAEIIVSDLLVIAAVSIVLCTLGALIPAMRAARLDPAQALRYE